MFRDSDGLRLDHHRWARKREGLVARPEGAAREVPLMRALSAALACNRYLRGERVLYREDGIH
jgi:hypothetical protein